MKKFSFETFRSPPIAFLLYITVACMLILIVRYFLPGEAAPLPYFSKSWRTIRGLLEIFELFPALALAALVVPLGFIPTSGEASSFSPKFFKKISGPVTIAIVSAVIYGIIQFLAMPLACNYEENLRFKGSLYRLAKERAEDHRDKGEWLEALQFTGVCESVWPESPEIVSLRNEIDIRMHEAIFQVEDIPVTRTTSGDVHRNEAGLAGIPGMTQPLDNTSAMAQAQDAFNKENYFDAHWLATIAERLAVPGSVEATRANRLAGRAWDEIRSQEPNRQERERYSVYYTKQSGYQAMVSGDWIRAFYIFQELIKKTPNDPDVRNFLEISEEGTTSISFFIDEMEFSLEQNIAGTLLSIPARTRFGGPGRAVIRMAGFFAGPDFAYGTGFEYLSFDSQSKPYVRITAPYVKLLPRTLDNQAKVVILMQSLDRHDENRRWEPAWSFDGEEARRSGDMQIVLDLSYEDMLTLSRTKLGLASMTMEELFTASKLFAPFGYIPQTFEAEVLDRLGTVLFFLPASIGALILGWRYRARSRPRYLFFPMLPVLSLVFHGILRLGRVLMYNFGIWLTLSFNNFSSSVAIFGGVLTALFVIAMIGLAAQKEE